MPVRIYEIAKKVGLESKEVLAKANEPRSGDVLAGVAAQSSQERT